MKKREEILKKTDGHCAYCGVDLSGKKWHADHIDPIFRGWDKKPERAGSDELENMYPACRRCNLRKSTLTVEQFRDEISKQADRLRRDSSAFRLAEDFGVVKITHTKPKFYFERGEG